MITAITLRKGLEKGREHIPSAVPHDPFKGGTNPARNRTDTEKKWLFL
jgi:hypothetical protein